MGTVSTHAYGIAHLCQCQLVPLNTCMRIFEIADDHRALTKAESRLKRYTYDGETSLSNTDFEELVDMYPFDGGTLYRGVHFDTKEEYLDFKKIIESGTLKTNWQSSWTISDTTAKDFATSKKTYDPTPQIMKAEADRREAGDYMTGYGGMVISTTVPENVGIDIDKTDFVKESEVLLPKGEYQVKIHFEQFAFSHQYKDKEHELVKQLSSTDRIHRERVATFLLRNISKLTNQNDIDAVINANFDLGEINSGVSIRRDNFNTGGNEIKVWVSELPSVALIKKTSPKMQLAIAKKLKPVLSKIHSEIAKLDLSDVMSIGDVYNTKSAVTVLKAVAPIETARALKPLVQHFANLYKELNTSGKTTQAELRKNQS